MVEVFVMFLFVLIFVFLQNKSDSYAENGFCLSGGDGDDVLVRGEV